MKYIVSTLIKRREGAQQPLNDYKLKKQHG